MSTTTITQGTTTPAPITKSAARSLIAAAVGRLDAQIAGVRKMADDNACRLADCRKTLDQTAAGMKRLRGN